MHKQIPLIIGGPTASGKSAYAMEVAEKMNGVIINGDSMQVYVDLPVLTAHPSKQDQQGMPHALYAIIAGSEVYSAARWREAAIAEIKRCEETNLRPIFVGGTGLYFLSLIRGLAHIPDIEPEIREFARQLYVDAGPDEFYLQLIELDPLAADRLNPYDQQRLIRAYEVKRSTGISIIEWQKNPPVDPGIECEMVVIERSREKLHQRAANRFDQMLDSGAIQEVKALLEKGYQDDLPVMRALGVRELAAYISNQLTIDEAREMAITATRQYIKRQSTFFRNQFPKAERLEFSD